MSVLPAASTPTVHRTFAAPGGQGGKLVSVFPHAQGDPQARATQAKTPLSVFVESSDAVSVRLRVFTPQKEKGGSDSAAVAALTHLSESGPLSDSVHVFMGGEDVPAQLCGGEWLLRQGEVTVCGMGADLSPIGLHSAPAWMAQTERPNLVVECTNLATLDGFQPDAQGISAVNRATCTTGLILFAMGGPVRADVSFRAFGPLKGFLEDAASSNMLACLVGVLGTLGRLPTDSNLLRAAQRMPGSPARLTAQFDLTESGRVEVWVGGAAEAEVVEPSKSLTV